MSDREPAPGDVRDAAPLTAIAPFTCGKVEAQLADAVRAARDAGHAWSVIAVFLGGSAQVAQRRCGASTEVCP